MYNNFRIAIIGGGPGGLTLARLLATRGIGATVFERDAHALARPQDGSLDLHVESGQLALREAGLEVEFRSIARYEDQEVRLYDKAGTLLFEDCDVASGDRPEVDRTALRAILIDSLPAGTIRWGQKVRGVQANGDGSYAILGESPSAETFDLVVGADGAWSRVRPLVSAASPLYTGVQFFELAIDDVDRRQPRLGQLVGRGKIFALGDGKGLIAQRSDHAHVRIYAAFSVPEDWLAKGAVDVSDAARARADLLRHFDGWAPALTELIARADDGVAARAIVALPIGHRWPSRAGVTLLGDAAHVMSPFTGEGVNIAMLDALELARRLTSGQDWRAAMQDYEATMFARAAVEAHLAAQGLESAMSRAAPQSFLEALQSIAHGAQQSA